MYYIGYDHVHPYKIDKRDKDEEEKRETIANIPGCGMAPERYVSSSPDPNM
jgi:hypothetical protein